MEPKFNIALLSSSNDGGTVNSVIITAADLDKLCGFGLRPAVARLDLLSGFSSSAVDLAVDLPERSC